MSWEDSISDWTSQDPKPRTAFVSETVERQKCYVTKSFTISGTLKMNYIFYYIRKEDKCGQLC